MLRTTDQAAERPAKLSPKQLIAANTFPHGHHPFVPLQDIVISVTFCSKLLPLFVRYCFVAAVTFAL